MDVSAIYALLLLKALTFSPVSIDRFNKITQHKNTLEARVNYCRIVCLNTKWVKDLEKFMDRIIFHLTLSSTFALINASLV